MSDSQPCALRAHRDGRLRYGATPPRALPPGQRRRSGASVILVVNGPNLSQLGARDPAVYGGATLAQVMAGARQEHPDVEEFTSEAEGELITRLHAAVHDGTQAVVINPGALAHYSYALRDALEILHCPKVEVHLSQTPAREAFRRTSVVSPVVDATITGVGAYGYRLAVRAALHLLADRSATRARPAPETPTSRAADPEV
ncbi:MAG: 3-dehydroquinate dehydratase, partial [Euzebyales bacterium]|nr:3-dehydroquinate dehydratase [Euzebyales bacterium]